MATFSELLSHFIQRSGITDAELARGIGVRRQTIFRWKEGLVERPRHRDDVLQLAKRLRLTPKEQDALLIAAGFPPEQMPPLPAENALAEPDEMRATKVASHTVQSESAGPVDAAATATTDRAASATDALPPLAPDPNPQPAAVKLAAPHEPIHNASPAARSRLHNVLSSRQWRVALPILVLAALLGFLLQWGGVRNLWAPTPTAAPGTVPLLTLQTPTPAPTATAYSIVAQEGETLLLVATFANYAGNAGFNIAGRIEEALQEQIDQANLADIRVVALEEVVGNGTKAEAQLASARAAMLLWGEYDNARVVVNFTVRGDLENPNIRRELLSLDELPTVINRDVPQQVRSLALFTLGQLFRGEGKLEQAKAALENALALTPSDELRGKIHFYLGSIYGQGNASELDRAIASYAEAIALRPTDANAFYNRGLAYWNRYRLVSNAVEDLDRAIEDFTQTLTLKPSYAKAYLNRGAVYYARSGPDQRQDADTRRRTIQRAVADFGRVIQLEPESYEAYYNRGLAYIRAGGNALWVADLEHALELATPQRERDIYTALCWGHTLAQQPQEALPHCQRAAEMAPNRGDVEDSLGMLYAQLGDLEKAISHFNRYLTWLKTQPPGYYSRYNGPRIEEWILALVQGENPITAATLEELR